ncbi:MAG TPA: ABC transporter permease [Firmicutes bacterium]|jgi:ABC-2 type transport system permease protein|nr:ABC transporter permease [Bacillota bacterium]
MMISTKRVLAMIWFSISRTLRSPSEIALVFLLPITVSLAIAGMFHTQNAFNPAHVAVADEDRSPLSEALIEALAATPYRVHLVSREEAEAAIAERKWHTGVVIPQGFSTTMGNKTPVLEVLHNDRSDGRQVEARVRLIVSALAGDAPKPAPLIVAATPSSDVDFEGFSSTRGAFGIYIMFALMTLLGRSGALHIERKEGRLQRTLANGVPYREIVVSHVCSIMTIGALQASMVVGITSLLGINWFAAGFAAVFLPIMATLFAGAGLAVMASGLTRSASQTQVLSGGLPTLAAMLGGAFFPLEVAPAAVQQIAALNPVYWGLEALTASFMYQGEPLVIPFVALLIIGSLGMMLGIQGLRRMAL